MGFPSRSLTITTIQPPGLPAYSGARISQNVSPPIWLVGSCEVDHDLLATTSRARIIASTRIAISGRPGSSLVKFGVGLVTTYV
jgi:hypothetical protein